MLRELGLERIQGAYDNALSCLTLMPMCNHWQAVATPADIDGITRTPPCKPGQATKDLGLKGAELR